MTITGIGGAAGGRRPDAANIPLLVPWKGPEHL